MTIKTGSIVLKVKKDYDYHTVWYNMLWAFRNDYDEVWYDINWGIFDKIWTRSMHYEIVSSMRETL